MGEFITSHELPALVKNGLISRNLYVKALSLFRHAKAWDGWALRSLLALGVGHVLAGIVFFFAYNWMDLSQDLKFGLVFFGMILSAFAWVGFKLDKPIAQVFGISLTVLIGVFLAVFGQVFQTPAALYTPFTTWALLSLPFAIVSRSLAHWAVWLVIAAFAANSYIVLGLEHTYGDDILVMSFTVVAAAFLALLPVYDRVQNIWPEWARAGWFRVLLVATGFVFANIALVVALFARNVDWFWPLIFCLSVGVLYYLYSLRKNRFTGLPPARIASLVLAASGVGVMAAQIGLRAIAEVTDRGDDFVFGLLLAFLWMALITFLLAKAFRHFAVRFKEQNVNVDEIENKEQIHKGDFNPSRRLDIVDFTSALQMDADATRQAVKDAEDNVSWYMEMFLGFAGIFTAILAMCFFGTLLAVTLKIDDPNGFLFLGLVVYGLATFVRLKTNGLFPRHFFNTLLMGGGALAVVGAGLLFEVEVGFIIFSMLLSALTLWLVHDRILEFLMAAGFAGLLVYSLIHYHVPYAFIWLYVLCVILGIFCITWPLSTGIGQARSQRVLGAAGAAFLLAPCIFAFFLLDFKVANQLHLGMSGGWAERVASVVMTTAAVWYLNRLRGAGEPFRPPYLILLLLLIAITFMPLGCAAALLLVLTGYILGLRSLTLVGALAQIAYIVWYYYDMDITLLNKSLLLMGFGSLLLLAYGIAFKRGERNV